MGHIVMAVTNLLAGATCLLVGLAIQRGKMNSMMDAEVKTKFNVKATNKFVGWVILTIPSIVLLVASIPTFLNFFPLIMFAMSWGLFLAVVIGGCIYVNTASRFRLTR